MNKNIRIWESDDGMIHYELSDDNGVPFSHTAMNAREWYRARTKTMKLYPADVSMSMLTDYLTALMNEVFDCKEDADDVVKTSGRRED